MQEVQEVQKGVGRDRLRGLPALSALPALSCTQGVAFCLSFNKDPSTTRLRISDEFRSTHRHLDCRYAGFDAPKNDAKIEESLAMSSGPLE
jgi:hypothetical protein